MDRQTTAPRARPCARSQPQLCRIAHWYNGRRVVHGGAARGGLRRRGAGGTQRTAASRCTEPRPPPARRPSNALHMRCACRVRQQAATSGLAPRSSARPPRQPHTFAGAGCAPNRPQLFSARETRHNSARTRAEEAVKRGGVSRRFRIVSPRASPRGATAKRGRAVVVRKAWRASALRSPRRLAPNPPRAWWLAHLRRRRRAGQVQRQRRVDG